MTRRQDAIETAAVDANWRFADDLGPETIAYLHNPAAGLRIQRVVYVVLVRQIAINPRRNLS